MRRNRLVLLLITAVVIVVFIFCLMRYAAPLERSPISLIVWSDNGSQTVELWQSGEEYYAFLPSYADFSRVRIKLNTGNTVRLNEVALTEGMDCSGFVHNTTYRLSYSVFGKPKEYGITFVQSANVPTMYIDTESGSMDYIHENKNNEETGAYHLYSAEGMLTCSGKLKKIGGRGNYSWTMTEKKSYRLSLSEESNLLGLGCAQKWILLANAADASNMRNKIVYDFADATGLSYSPDSQWVDVFFNGEYAGLYLLSERNEVHSERIDIAMNDSFLVSLELEDRLIQSEQPYITTQTNQTLRIHCSSLDSDELVSIWQSVENAILAEDGIDPVTGKNWYDLIDVDSWAKKYLIEEVFGNLDGGFISQFFYYNGTDKTGKIYAGPVWDYDLSFGNQTEWQNRYTNAIFTNRLEAKEGVITPWFYHLCQKQEFFERVIELYQSDFLPQLEELCDARLRIYSDYITVASEMNRLRWFSDTQEYTNQTEYLVDYLRERMDFLNSMWIQKNRYCTVRIDDGRNSNYAYHMVLPGTYLQELPALKQPEQAVFIDWYRADTNEPFDINQPITEDIEIYAKWEETSTKKLGQIIKLIPLGVIGVMGIVLLIIDIKRTRNSRYKE